MDVAQLNDLSVGMSVAICCSSDELPNWLKWERDVARFRCYMRGHSMVNHPLDKELLVEKIRAQFLNMDQL